MHCWAQTQRKMIAWQSWPIRVSCIEFCRQPRLFNLWRCPVKLKTLSLAIGLGLIGQPCHAEILIGFVTGLSGPVSSIGIPNSKGLKAGELYTGDIGGQKIPVIQLDDASDPTSSTQNARKLIEENHVDMLIGTSGTPQTTAMATIASQLKT